jgi:hypothetical protein
VIAPVPKPLKRIIKNDPKKLDEALDFFDDVVNELEKKHAQQIKETKENQSKIVKTEAVKPEEIKSVVIEEIDDEEDTNSEKNNDLNEEKKIEARRKKRAKAKRADKRLKALKGEKGDRGRDGSSGGAVGTKGERGEKGEKGDNGSDGTSVIWRGAYSPTAGYTVLNAVSYQGSSYICKVATVGNPPTNATYWDTMASVGDDGSGTIDYSLVIAYSIALG